MWEPYSYQTNTNTLILIISHSRVLSELVPSYFVISVVDLINTSSQTSWFKSSKVFYYNVSEDQDKLNRLSSIERHVYVLWRLSKGTNFRWRILIRQWKIIPFFFQEGRHHISGNHFKNKPIIYTNVQKIYIYCIGRRHDWSVKTLFRVCNQLTLDPFHKLSKGQKVSRCYWLKLCWYPRNSFQEAAVSKWTIYQSYYILSLHCIKSLSVQGCIDIKSFKYIKINK